MPFFSSCQLHVISYFWNGINWENVIVPCLVCSNIISCDFSLSILKAGGAPDAQTNFISSSGQLKCAKVFSLDLT